MKTKTLLFYFFILLLLLISGLATGFYFFNHEKENALHKSLSLQQKNSLELITENVYGDLLIDNTMEVERKLNVMVEKKIIESFSIQKGESAVSVENNQCQTIYFDKLNKIGKWGIFCVDFSSEHLGNSFLNLKGVTVVVVLLATFLVLIIIGIFKQISKLNHNLHRGVASILESSENQLSDDELWSPVLNQLREEVRKKKKAEEELLKKHIEEEKIQIAHQVSHDIRSPLAVLKMALDDVETIALEQRLLIENALSRINEISNNLLINFKKQNKIELENHSLVKVMEAIIAEKKFQYKELNQLEFIFEPSLEAQRAYVKILPSDFHRIISNIINNSVEAMKDQGTIRIKIDLHDPLVTISISDNGLGIPKERLAQIGQKGMSFGKDENVLSGSGLGLFHAKKTIKDYGGQFLIDSEVGVGTTVSLSLPMTENIEVSSLSFYEYVLIDNDKIIRFAWAQKAKKAHVKLLTLSSIDEFDKYREKISKKETRIYLDSDLGEESLRGEEFALVLYQEGYQHIFMASSFHMPEVYPWLKNSGKAAPF